MTLTISIPAALEETLRNQFGANLEKCARENLAASWFSEGRITSRQVATLLEMSLFEAHAFLKSRGAAAPMTIEEIESDLASLRELRS